MEHRALTSTSIRTHDSTRSWTLRYAYALVSCALAAICACSGGGTSSNEGTGGEGASSGGTSHCGEARTELLRCADTRTRENAPCGIDACSAKCFVDADCQGDRASSCLRACREGGGSTSGGAPDASWDSSSAGTTSSDASSSGTPFPQCAGFAVSMCKCNNGSSSCIAAQRSTCETYFYTCPNKAAVYYACAPSAIHCSNGGGSLDPCTAAAAKVACN